MIHPLTGEETTPEKIQAEIKRCKCGKPAEEGVDFCQNHSPYFSGGLREQKKPEKVGNTRI